MARRMTVDFLAESAKYPSSITVACRRNLDPITSCRYFRCMRRKPEALAYLAYVHDRKFSQHILLQPHAADNRSRTMQLCPIPLDQ